MNHLGRNGFHALFNGARHKNSTAQSRQEKAMNQWISQIMERAFARPRSNFRKLYYLRPLDRPAFLWSIPRWRPRLHPQVEDCRNPRAFALERGTCSWGPWFEARGCPKGPRGRSPASAFPWYAEAPSPRDPSNDFEALKSRLSSGIRLPPAIKVSLVFDPWKQAADWSKGVHDATYQQSAP